MATYNPQQIGIKAPTTGFQQGGWYSGRQFWNGTLSDAGVIHPESNQQGAGQAVSPEVNAASAAQQGVSSQQFNNYISTQNAVQPTAANMTAGGGSSLGGMGTGTGLGLTGGAPTAPGVPNVEQMYTDLMASPEMKTQQAAITAKMAQLEKLRTDAAAAEALINDNPYFSEATRTGKIAKQREAAAAAENNLITEVQNQQSVLDKMNADVQTKLNLSLKQYDINSQEYQNTMSRFNMMLESGALTNASGSDIASLATMTGMSTSMIEGVIATAKQKAANVQIVSTTDDYGNVTFVAVDQNTGRVVNQETVKGIGNRQGDGSTKETKADVIDAIKADIRNKTPIRDLLSIYDGAAGVTANEIYQWYNQSSPWGPAKESAGELAAWGIKTNIED